MASTISSSFLSFQTPSLILVRTNHPISCKACSPKTEPAAPHASRRNLLLLSLTALPVLTARVSASSAQDIPLFGLRKKLKQAEDEAVEIVMEAEKNIETAERKIEAAEKEIETTGSFGGGGGGLAQAGAVAGAEVVGLLVATAVVNGILGPEPQ